MALRYESGRQGHRAFQPPHAAAASPSTRPSTSGHPKIHPGRDHEPRLAGSERSCSPHARDGRAEQRGSDHGAWEQPPLTTAPSARSCLHAGGNICTLYVSGTDVLLTRHVQERTDRMARAGVTRITADVPDEDVKRLERLADRIHSNKTTALVRALRTADLLEEASAAGAKIMIVDPDGTRREIVMP